MTVTFETAARAAEGASAAARRLGVAAVVSVVDAGGHLVLLHRMDGAPFGAVRFSERKAMTAAALGVATGGLAQAVGAMPGLMSAAFDGMALVAGGLPVTASGVLAGGIGVAGGMGEQDETIARAGLAALAPSGV